ncbi:MAG TPA: DNA-protecting protein DprA [Bacteroidales bacterium]|nr:DNA-protecting protein DprA [Bacteroidales bacterium]
MSLLHQMALTYIPGVGNVIGKKLMAVCGSAEAVFTEKKSALLKAERVGELIVNSIMQHRILALEKAAKELEFIQRYKIKTLFYTDKDYPSRLKECVDGPILVYFKGNANLNHPRIVAVVGTRRATHYGKEMCEKIIEGLKNLDVLVVSGLAYGIDTYAHKTALDRGLQSIAVLAHGLDRIYPPLNKSLAERMLNQGGLLSDFPSGTNPDRENFPARNRIIAGIADATIVIESGLKGGALITAEIANSYNRDVFSVPGNIGNYYSEGCNFLIKSNRAALLQSAEDIKYIMNWGEPVKNKVVQRKLMIELSPEQEKIVEVLKNNAEASIDRLCNETAISPALVANALLNLEFEGIIKTLPGKMYKLV